MIMTKDKADTGGTPIRSVDRTFRILEELKLEDSISISVLSERLDLPVSTVHHHLSTMRKHGYVTKHDGSYQITSYAVTLGGPARDRVPIFRYGRSDVDKLASETGETARLVIENRGYGITVYQAKGDNAEKTKTRLGTQEQLHSTAAGKAFLASVNKERTESIIQRQELRSYTENTITDRQTLYEELEMVRDRGVAYDLQERWLGTRCIAAPVVREDDLLGAVSLSAPVSRKDQEWFESDAIDFIRNTTGVITLTSRYSSLWESNS